MAKKAKVQSAPDATERFSNANHADALGDIKRRLWGLRAAIYGIEIDNDDPDVKGAYQLCDDICDQMEACTTALSAERELRDEEASQ